MPPGGHPARAESMATLGRLAHERFVDDEVGRLLERLRPLEESLEYDSDDASLDPRHAPRLGEGAPRPDRAAHRDDPRCGAREPGLDRGARDERLREVPARARAQPRPQAALRRVLRVDGLAVHAAPRRLRAVHGDAGGRRGLRDDPAGARGARARGSGGRRELPRASPSTPRDEQEFGEQILATLGFEPARTGSTRRCIPSAPRSRGATSA